MANTIVKSNIRRLLFGGIFLTIGFVVGSLVQYAKTSYHFRLLEEKKYPFALGTVE